MKTKDKAAIHKEFLEVREKRRWARIVLTDSPSLANARALNDLIAKENELLSLLKKPSSQLP